MFERERVNGNCYRTHVETNHGGRCRIVLDPVDVGVFGVVQEPDVQVPVRAITTSASSNLDFRIFFIFI